jgi:hypothetical protein
MKEVIKYVIAIVIPTIIVISWMTLITSCAAGETKCSIQVPSISTIPIFVFVLYTVFYGISVLVSRYRIVKRN